MKLFASLGRSIFALARRPDVDREMNDELESHIDHRADHLERSGLSRSEAQRRARIEFGGYERFKEECRDALGTGFLEALRQDARVGFRMLRKSPGFSVIAIVTLAIGIAANSVVFSVLNALVLRPIDLPRPQSLVMIEYGKRHFEQSYPDYLDLRDRNRTFEGMTAFTITAAGLDSGQGSSRVWIYESSGNYFDVLGIQPYLGRFFHGSDDHGPLSAPYVVLSYVYWRNHFQGDRNVVGTKIQLNKAPFTVLGVAPPQFRGTALFFAADLWVPLVAQAPASELNQRGFRNLWIVGRMKPEVTKPQVAADLDSIAAGLAKTYPKDDDDASFNLTRPELMGDFIGKAARAFVAGLTALAGLILLAACANLGSLFAARAADRSKEIALRMALGASRARIVRQLLTEATMIALAGGAAGLAGSIALLPWLSAFQPLPEFPINVPVNPDASVYVVALLLALGSGLVFGLVPVRQVLRTDPHHVIKSGTSGAPGRFALRDLLVVAQIAICAVLVTASFVAVRGLMRSLNASFGVRTQKAMLLETDLSMARYTESEQPVVQRRILDAVLAIPGVTTAAYANTVPLNLDQTTRSVYADSSTDLRPSKAAARTVSYQVSPGYFDAAGTTLLAGRAFTWHDDKDAPPVGVVNREFARQVFGSVEKALGGHYKTAEQRIEVVGVAEDGKYSSLTEDPSPAMFVPILQSPANSTWLIVRSGQDPGQLAGALHQQMRTLDPGLPFTIRTWRQELDGVLFPARVATVSLGVLGALGAMLAVTGIFGMTAYSVSKRLREFGIRIALGADREEILRAALGRTFRILAVGSSAGLLLGLAASRVLAFIVYQATPRDPLVLAAVILAMLAAGLVAAWVPARRALSTDPSILLREQ